MPRPKTHSPLIKGAVPGPKNGIVLVRGAVGSTNAGQSGVLDLARGEIRWIGAAQSAVIVYE